MTDCVEPSSGGVRGRKSTKISAASVQFDSMRTCVYHLKNFSLRPFMIISYRSVHAKIEQPIGHLTPLTQAIVQTASLL